MQQLYVRRLDGTEARPIPNTEGAQALAVSADGQWVAFWTARAIRKVPLGGGPVMDLASGITSPPWGLVWDVRGAEGAVLDTVAQSLAADNSRSVTGAGQFAIAATGTLAWVSGPVTPDSLTERGLWLYDVGRGIPIPLVRGGEASWPVWSPDEQRLVFDFLLDGRRSIVTQRADGTATPQVLVPRGFPISSSTPDGRQLVGVQSGDIVIVTVESGTARAQPLFQTPHTEQWPAFSPDGHWLAYGSNVSSRYEVWVQPYPDPGAAVQVSIDGASSPAWNPNGRELFFVSAPDLAGKRRMMAVDFDAGSPPRIRRPHTLFSFDERDLKSFACGTARCYDVAPDGQRFYAV